MGGYKTWTDLETLVKDVVPLEVTQDKLTIICFLLRDFLLCTSLLF